MEDILNKYIDRIENDNSANYDYMIVIEMLKDLKEELNNLNK